MGYFIELLNVTPETMVTAQEALFSAGIAGDDNDGIGMYLLVGYPNDVTIKYPSERLRAVLALQRAGFTTNEDGRVNDFYNYRFAYHVKAWLDKFEAISNISPDEVDTIRGFSRYELLKDHLRMARIAADKVKEFDGNFVLALESNTHYKNNEFVYNPGSMHPLGYFAFRYLAAFGRSFLGKGAFDLHYEAYAPKVFHMVINQVIGTYGRNKAEGQS